MAILGVSPPRNLERVALAASIGLLTGVAWLALAFSDDWGHRVFHASAGHAHMHGHTAPVFPFLFVAGWLAMTVAMMLPTTLPVLSTLHAIARRRDDRFLLIALVVAGYIAAWVVFGVLAWLAGGLLRWAAAAVPWLEWLSGSWRPALLLVAGAFQFSPLKYRCLEKCRSPLSFVIKHWQGRRHAWLALRLGIDNGAYCVGCCWALMLLMFILGSASLLWMLALAVVMGIEKNVAWGRRLSAPLGVVLLAWGAAWLLRG